LILLAVELVGMIVHQETAAAVRIAESREEVAMQVTIMVPMKMLNMGVLMRRVVVVVTTVVLAMMVEAAEVVAVVEVGAVVVAVVAVVEATAVEIVIL
jgi:hypothetical protein